MRSACTAAAFSICAFLLVSCCTSAFSCLTVAIAWVTVSFSLRSSAPASDLGALLLGCALGGDDSGDDGGDPRVKYWGAAWRSVAGVAGVNANDVCVADD